MEGGETERRLVRLLIGSRMLRRRRVRRAVIAHLLKERGEGEGDEGEGDEAEGDEDGGEDGGVEGGDTERRLVRLLIGSRMLRRRRVRRALLAHLLKERGEGGGDEDADEGEEDDDGGDEATDKGRELVRLLVARGAMQRRRGRRAGALARRLRNGEDAY